MPHEETIVTKHENRFERLEESVNDLKEWRASMIAEHQDLKAGVANFRLFKDRGTQFFERFEAIADAEEEAAKKRWKRSDKIAVVAIVAVLLAPPSYKVGQICADIYQITQEWRATHHAENPHKAFFDAPSALSSSQKPQPNLK